MNEESNSDTRPGGAGADGSDGSDPAHDPRALRGRPFAKGVSGNPHGRPFGTRNRSTLLAQSYFDEVATAISDKAIALALEGDPVALKLCVERILPRRRDTAVVIEEMPEVGTAVECTQALAAVIRSAAAGEISPSQAQVFVGLIEGQLRSLSVADLEQRLTSIEHRLGTARR